MFQVCILSYHARWISITPWRILPMIFCMRCCLARYLEMLSVCPLPPQIKNQIGPSIPKIIEGSRSSSGNFITTVSAILSRAFLSSDPVSYLWSLCITFECTHPTTSLDLPLPNQICLRLCTVRSRKSSHSQIFVILSVNLRSTSSCNIHTLRIACLSDSISRSMGTSTRKCRCNLWICLDWAMQGLIK